MNMMEFAARIDSIATAYQNEVESARTSMRESMAAAIADFLGPDLAPQELREHAARRRDYD